MKYADFKKKYSELEKKYKMPSFKELNENFEVYKGMGKDEDFLLRGVRKSMIDKVVNAMGFLDMLLTGMNAPRIYFNYIKNMSADDRKKIENMYSLFGTTSMASMSLEIEYSEKDEAKLIISLNKMWNSVKEDFKVVLDNMRNVQDNNVKKDRSYYG